MRPVQRSAFTLVALAAVLLLVACDGADSVPAETDHQASVALPELATIAGVRDVWPFGFGLSASRSAVRDALGEPADVQQSASRDGTAGSAVEIWRYEGVQLTFLVDETRDQEYLLSARISDDGPALRGGLTIGMSTEAARSLLGEPQVADDARIVYFYRDTTIELRVDDGIVASVHLARALP